VAEVAAWRGGVRVFHEYAPSTVKAAVGAGGRGKKELVAKLVTRILGLAHEPQADAADALAISICAARRIHDA
jgi:crossover junction endodeoxyribonuclease RuvC